MKFPFPLRKNVITGCESTGTVGVPYMTRYYLLDLPAFQVCIHYFHRSDVAGDYHDHPWSFWTLVLWRGYTEHLLGKMPNPELENLSDFSYQCLWAVWMVGTDPAEDGPAYAALIWRKVSELMDRQVSMSTLFLTLENLEERGLVRSWQGGAFPGETRHNRKYFVLTGDGAGALNTYEDAIGEPYVDVDKARRVWPGQMLLRRAQTMHRVELLGGKPAVTLCIMGKRHRVWGFRSVHGLWRNFRQYFAEKGC